MRVLEQVGSVVGSQGPHGAEAPQDDDDVEFFRGGRPAETGRGGLQFGFSDAAFAAKGVRP